MIDSTKSKSWRKFDKAGRGKEKGKESCISGSGKPSFPCRARGIIQRGGRDHALVWVASCLSSPRENPMQGQILDAGQNGRSRNLRAGLSFARKAGSHIAAAPLSASIVMKL